MSPRLLCELLAFTGWKWRNALRHLTQIPWRWGAPSPGLGLNRRRGGSISPWELTEWWHHQQQIRDATGHPPLYDPDLLSPVLDAFVRALPYAYRNAVAPAGTCVRFEISGEAGGVWFVSRDKEAWVLLLDATAEPATNVVIPQDLAWRLFTKGIDRGKARSLALIDGNAHLAAPIFATTAIIG